MSICTVSQQEHQFKILKKEIIMKCCTPKRRGFTVIELIIVSLVSAVLAALLLPATQQAREAARRTACRNNMKNIGLALFVYESDHGCFPPSYISDKNKNQLGWGTMILPQMDESPLYSKINKNEDWNVTLTSLQAAKTVVKYYHCPSDPTDEKGAGLNSHWVVKAGKDLKDTHVAKSNYVVNKAAFKKNISLRIRSFTDGPSNTILAGERDTKIGFGGIWIGAHRWDKKAGAYSDASIVGDALGSDKNVPYTINSKASRAHRMNTFSSTHVGGANFVFGDGRVRFLSENIGTKTYRALFTPDKEDIPCDF